MSSNVNSNQLLDFRKFELSYIENKCWLRTAADDVKEIENGELGLNPAEKITSAIASVHITIERSLKCKEMIDNVDLTTLEEKDLTFNSVYREKIRILDALISNLVTRMIKVCPQEEKRILDFRSRNN